MGLLLLKLRHWLYLDNIFLMSFYGVESVVHGNAASLLNWAADHRTAMHSLTTKVRTLPSIAGLQA